MAVSSKGRRVFPAKWTQLRCLLESEMADGEWKPVRLLLDRYGSFVTPERAILRARHTHCRVGDMERRMLFGRRHEIASTLEIMGCESRGTSFDRMFRMPQARLALRQGAHTNGVIADDTTD